MVYKKSSYQLYVKERHDPAYERAMASDEDTTRRLMEGHERQEEALSTVRDVLTRRGISFRSRWRGKTRSSTEYALVIAVGGDGTLLDTAQHLRDKTPLLGINSDPRQSVGKLCAGVAGDLDTLLSSVEDGSLKPLAHSRIRVRLDGEEILGPGLNEVLFAHRSPANMSRFQIRVLPEGSGSPPHDVRSSGIWVATATGSTAAIRSAGGKVMPPRSRRLQFLLRESYTPPDEAQIPRNSNFLTPGEEIELTSRMNSAFLWVDGPYRRKAVRYGQRVHLDVHPQPLWLYRREYLRG